MAENKQTTDNASENESSRSADEPTSRSGVKRKIILAILIVAVALGVIFGWPYYRYAMSHASTDDAFIDGNIVPVSTRVAGHVSEVFVKDNQHVEKGQLLFELDPAPFEAKRDAAKAALAVAIAKHRSSDLDTQLTRATSEAQVQYAQAGVTQAKSALTTAKARVQAAGSALAEAQAQITAAKAAANRDQLDLKRYERLHKTGAVSPQTYDHAVAAAAASQAQLQQAQAAAQAAADQKQVAESRLDEARATLQQAQANLTKAKTAPKQVELSAAQQPVRESEVTQAKADLKQAQLNLQYTQIRAATTGRVTKKSVEPGQYVQPGQMLMSIVPADIWVTANYKETQLAPIQPGQPVSVTVDAYPDTTFQAHVDSIMRGTGARFSLLPPENATGNYVKVVQRVPVKIVFDQQPGPAYHLAPGMSVVPEINIAAKSSSTQPQHNAVASTQPVTP